ncbi:MAG: serine/threonine protein kinase [Planctomycetes bacterium]|nr:serine/threonine protein kinase [Planctomycetota bacterium]
MIEALDEYMAALEAGHKPDRQAFLARHAAVAEGLAECLEGMDVLHDASSASASSLSPLFSGGKGGTAGDCQPGMPLGDFRILREIGRGGMGVVYEAEQLSLGRRIALKVLPFALTLDPRQLQRFKNEARAAAQLHHPHIVPVYYVGSERGVHFYAMQFIEGQSLAEVIQGLRQLAGSAREQSRRETTGPYVPPSGAAVADTAAEPVGALATAYSKNTAQFYRAVARLGAQAAEALEHAHECGVIHRDVKPGNLLVDAHGHLWVTDFGLAQFQADTKLTQTGDLLGTLRYMSPEQAGGQRVPLDQGTDVYSLGATLYELLTLRPPFDGADRQTLLQQILRDEPRPPRAVEKSLPAELETIVLKAMAKAPAERYATARDFADDLQRFLEHQPIRARRATAVQRVRKWARRHPSVVVTGVVLCVLTAAGSLLSAEMIRREQAKTQAAYEQERQRADLARKAVNEMIQLAEKDLAGNPHLQGLRKRLLEAALAYYQEFIEQRRDDPDARAELRATKDRVKKILDDLALLQGAWQLSLLSESTVRDDLRLSDEQRQRIKDLAHRIEEQRQKSFGGFHRLSPEEREQRFVEMARVNDAAVAEILSREQLRRLGQIALQLRGAAAFREADVAKALNLTDSQKERISAIEAEMFFGPPEFWHGDPSRGDLWKALEQKLQVASQRIQDMLTEQQAKQWKKMTGEQFKGPTRLCLPPWHFGPGGIPPRPGGGPHGPGGPPPGGPRRPGEGPKGPGEER